MVVRLALCLKPILTSKVPAKLLVTFVLIQKGEAGLAAKQKNPSAVMMELLIQTDARPVLTTNLALTRTVHAQASILIIFVLILKEKPVAALKLSTMSAVMTEELILTPARLVLAPLPTLTSQVNALVSSMYVLRLKRRREIAMICLKTFVVVMDVLISIPVMLAPPMVSILTFQEPVKKLSS